MATITIAQYKFNSSFDTLPTFNADFVYTYTDVDNSDGTITRTIMSDSIPNSISFMSCIGLLEVYDLNLGNLTNLDNLFYGCYELTYIDLSKIKSNTEITSLNYAFYDCANLAGELDLSKLNVKITSILDSTFRYCDRLTSINLNGWDISEAYSLIKTFADCTNLRTLNIDGWDFANIMAVSEMFLNTDALSTISIQNSIVGSISSFIYFALPQRTDTDNVLNIRGIDDLDSLTGSGAVSYAESYNWNIVYDVISDDDETTYISKLHLGNVIVDKLYIGNSQVNNIYIGETLLYSISSGNE